MRELELKLGAGLLIALELQSRTSLRKELELESRTRSTERIGTGVRGQVSYKRP